jgi:hypothetical protein
MHNRYVPIFNTKSAVQRILAMCLALYLSLMPAFSKDKADFVPPGNWGALKELRAGLKIVVVETTRWHLEGKFVSANDEALTLNIDGQQVSISRDKVTRVSSKGHRVRNAILLSILGLGVGAAIGHSQDTPTYTGDGPGAAIGGAIGALGGALIPTGKTYYLLDRPQPGTAEK